METERHSTRLVVEEPFLFYQEPPDWRWLSFEEVADRMSGWRSPLEETPRGARVKVGGSPSLEALVADLAVRASGRVSMPMLAGAAAGTDERALDLELEDTDRRRTPPPAAQAKGTASPATAIGDCVVRLPDGVGRREALLTSEGLMSAVDRLGAAICPFGRRPIIVHGRSLADLAERVVVEWAIREAAAIVMANPDSTLATASWARPTVFHGSAGELESWFHLATVERRGRPVLARRFRRLGAVVVTGGEGLEATARRQWGQLGVRVVELPRLELERLEPAGGDRL